MKQKGFTLVEVLVVTAIGGVLMMGLLLSIHNVLWGTNRSNNQVVALADVNYAALRLKKDLMMTQNTNLTDNVSQDSVVLSWIDYTGFDSENQSGSHSSSYTLSGTKLLRTYDSGNTSIVGRDITSIGFTQNGRVINVVITATGAGVPERSKTLKFSAYIRAEEIPG